MQRHTEGQTDIGTERQRETETQGTGYIATRALRKIDI